MLARTRDSLLARYGLPPEGVERLSLERLEAAAGNALPTEPGARQVARRVLYAAGDPTLASALRIHERLVGAAVQALRSGAPLVTDVSMVAAGIRQDLLLHDGQLVVAIQQPGASQIAAEEGITRSAAAIRLLAPRLDGALVAIGNAPTALLELLDQVDAGRAAPAAVVGMPVGLVAAEESKAELAARTIPFATVLGTRGGSPLAAAAVNALLELAHA